MSLQAVQDGRGQAVRETEPDGPVKGTKPPAEIDTAPDSLGPAACVGGFVHPFLEREAALPLCWHIWKLLCRPCSAWGSRCPGRSCLMGSGGGGGGRVGAELAAPVGCLTKSTFWHSPSLSKESE